MTEKSLNTKAILIKGKKYILVSDRVVFFNDKYPNGMIRTHLLSKPEDEMVVVKAQVVPDMANPERFFTGHSQAKWGDGYINKTSALENAETSAVGRALAMMGIGVIDSIASFDEVKKAQVSEDVDDPADNVICPIHKVKLMHFSKNDDEWWGHKLDNGKYCNGRETKYNKEL